MSGEFTFNRKTDYTGRMKFLQSPSPNFGPRVGCDGPDMVVLHYTAMDTAKAALARLCDPAAEVSAHYLIGEDGQVFHLVAEDQRAWHAGAAQWGGVRDVNSHSIGVELANSATSGRLPPFPALQMLALEALLGGILKRWTIAPARVLAHSDVAVGRKFDPGPKFDWRRLALSGLAIWPETATRPTAEEGWPAFETSTRQIGYRCPEGRTRAEVLDAVRLRFRPRALGRPFEAADLAVVQCLAELHPCIDPGSAAP